MNNGTKEVYRYMLPGATENDFHARRTMMLTMDDVLSKNLIVEKERRHIMYEYELSLFGWDDLTWSGVLGMQHNLFRGDVQLVAAKEFVIQSDNTISAFNIIATNKLIEAMKASIKNGGLIILPERANKIVKDFKQKLTTI